VFFADENKRVREEILPGVEIILDYVSEKIFWV